MNFLFLVTREKQNLSNRVLQFGGTSVFLSAWESGATWRFRSPPDKISRWLWHHPDAEACYLFIVFFHFFNRIVFLLKSLGGGWKWWIFRIKAVGRCKWFFANNRNTKSPRDAKNQCILRLCHNWLIFSKYLKKLFFLNENP